MDQVAGVFHGVTQNISSGGLYAVCDGAITARQQAHCIVRLGAAGSRGQSVILSCRLEVLRADPLGGKTGIACRFLDCVITEADSRRNAADECSGLETDGLKAGVAALTNIST
jgi:hypothetical protein